MNASPEPPKVTADDLVPGVTVRVRAGLRARPYGLKIIERLMVSKATGAVDLLGEVVSVDGTTTRKRRLLRRAVVMPGDVTIITRNEG